MAISADLLLDTQIRSWVFLPIVLITFLLGALRHYITILTCFQTQADLQQLQDAQILTKTRLLRENHRYVPAGAFSMRQQAYSGLLNTPREYTERNPATDPTMMMEMLKGNLTNVFPMIIIGSWINWIFSGFITTKVPFPLTLRFKNMLQREVELTQLDACWVSSASWYFINVFGLRSIYTLILGEDYVAETDKVPEQLFNVNINQNDTKIVFKAEKEALEMTEYNWALKWIHKDFL